MKTILLIFISLLSINLSAQDGINRISTSIKFGTEIGVMSLKQSALDNTSELDLGYSIMVDLLEYRISPLWSANIGIGFTNRNYRQSIETVHSTDIPLTVSGREHLLIQNIEVPLTIRYYITPKDQSRKYYLTAGSTVFYNLAHQSKQEIFFPDGSAWELNIQNDIERTTMAATFGAGVLFEANYRLSFILEPVLQVNFNTVDFIYGSSTNALVSLGLSVGVRF